MSNPFVASCTADASAGSASEKTFMTLASTLREAAPVLRPVSRARLGSIATSTGLEDSRRQCSHALRPSVLTLWLNSSYANLETDGAVWQGRGLTLALTGGGRIGRGPLSIALRPVLYAGENRSFEPKADTTLDPTDYRDPRYGLELDLPYRFGDRPIVAAAPGESHVVVELGPVRGGLTTESQHWGPAHLFPLTLSSEGAGYPRAFIETPRLATFAGNVTFHWQVGILESSHYSNLPVGQRSRIAAAVLASFSPAGLRGLEVGGTRFFHARRVPGSLSWSTATLPFSGLLKSRSRDVVVGGFNQLASIFARIAPPSSGVEVYGEYLRDDHSVELRDLTAELDHTAAYTIGLRRVRRGEGGTTVLTIEELNSRQSDLHRLAPQAVTYTHGAIFEGHTYLGQPLGSSAALAGGATVVALERIEDTRSRRVALELRQPSPRPSDTGLSGRGQVAVDIAWRWSRGTALQGARIRGAIGQSGTSGSNVTVSLSWADEWFRKR